MIMHAAKAKVVFFLPTALGGLFAASELEPLSWPQLGVAGVSFLILFWVIRALFQAINRIMDGHKESSAELSKSIDGLKGSFDDSRKEQLDLLREAIKR